MSTTLCLVAIFKNESHIIKEWIDHYLNQGVDKFFLIDNDSDDEYYSILEPYITSGKVDLVKDAKKHAQAELYNKHFLNKCRRYEWVIVCDLDEFIYGRKYCNSIKHFLSKVHNNFSQVFIPWKMFGSNGFDTMDKQQPSSVISAFTKRLIYNETKKNNYSFVFKGNKMYIENKCIVRTKYLVKLNLHHSETLNKRYLTSCVFKNNHIHEINNFTEINENIIENSALHLNHYAIQSLEWFMRVKATRGDASNITSDGIRTKKYFDRYDLNDIEDLELSTITNNIEQSK